MPPQANIPRPASGTNPPADVAATPSTSSQSSTAASSLQLQLPQPYIDATTQDATGSASPPLSSPAQRSSSMEIAGLSIVSISIVAGVSTTLLGVLFFMCFLRLQRHRRRTLARCAKRAMHPQLCAKLTRKGTKSAKPLIETVATVSRTKRISASSNSSDTTVVNVEDLDEMGSIVAVVNGDYENKIGLDIDKVVIDDMTSTPHVQRRPTLVTKISTSPVPPSISSTRDRLSVKTNFSKSSQSSHRSAPRSASPFTRNSTYYEHRNGSRRAKRTMTIASVSTNASRFTARSRSVSPGPKSASTMRELKVEEMWVPKRGSTWHQKEKVGGSRTTTLFRKSMVAKSMQTFEEGSDSSPRKSVATARSKSPRSLYSASTSSTSVASSPDLTINEELVEREGEVISISSAEDEEVEVVIVEEELVVDVAVPRRSMVKFTSSSPVTAGSGRNIKRTSIFPAELVSSLDTIGQFFRLYS
ncbi:hypothetical protein HK102_007463 [Quaeritorhiza haematococci]|nr:hypothetical protein HK102_007463 [Quaeritorhiza haematococci]